MERWVVAAKRADFTAIGKEFGIDPVIARLIRNRDVQDRDEIRRYLYGKVDELASPHLMKDVDKAVEILRNKIKEKKRIRIIGDYDIDGVVSTFILIKGLKRAGALADTYIPDRVADGYGIHEHLIERAANDGIDVIVTCDNGIAAYNEITMAKEKGMTVIITDHHEIPYKETEDGRELILPPADAIVNPKQPDCNYPEKRLCGAVVALKLVTALYEACGIPEKELEDFLELGAIATVGDVMDLQGENRILVKEGLKRLSHTSNKGLRELIRANGLEEGPITAYHVGFVLGPCINASGRLDTAKRALELLEAKKVAEADLLAGDLKALNDSRKDMTAQAVEEAFIQVENSELKDADVLVVYLPECHESLAGIVAGRIREKYYRPVFVLTKGAEGLKGSGRSIETWHMYEGLNRVKHLLSKFGGHKMAAGLSMPEENLEQFRKEINEKSGITPEDLNEKIAIDMQLPFECVNEKFIEELAVLEPFGKGNARPVFAERQVQVESARILGKNKNVLKLQVKDLHGTRMDAMYFGDVNTFVEYVREKFGDIACECLLRGHGHGIVMAFTYYPDINEYQGVRTPQIVIQNYK